MQQVKNLKLNLKIVYFLLYEELFLVLKKISLIQLKGIQVELN